MTNEKTKGLRGFALMDPAKQKQIASLGGKAAHEKGRAYQFDPARARAAGRKGGAKISQDREHMAAIGRIGGKVCGQIRRGEINETKTTDAE